MSVHLDSVSADERQWSMLGHVSGLLAFTGIPFGGVIGPWYVYLQNKKSRPVAAAQARNALNFHLTIGSIQVLCVLLILYGYFGSAVRLVTMHRQPVSLPPAIAQSLTIMGIAMFLWLAIYVWSFVFTLIGTIRASDDILYEYPLAIRFVR